MLKGRPNAVPAVCAGVWLVSVLSGLSILWIHASSPGLSAKAGDRWPGPAPNRWTLVLFAHPRCPCTRATLGELNAVLARAELSVKIFFVRPEGVSEDWVQSDLWDTAVSLRGAEVRIDEGGVQARIFGAATSGQTFLYRGNGSLVFRGGITAARGHAGDNAGRAAVLDWILRGRSEIGDTPVYGCPLFRRGGPTP